MTTTLAQAVGLDRERGRLAPGYSADMVPLTPDLRVNAAISEGATVYTA